MRASGSRGSVLLHVMVMGTVIAFISATLMRMALLRQQMGARGAKALAEKRADTAALASIRGAWNSVNTSCADNVPNYSCAPAATVPPGSCNCTCTPTGPDIATASSPQPYPITITAIPNPMGAGYGCQLQITSYNMP